MHFPADFRRSKSTLIFAEQFRVNQRVFNLLGFAGKNSWSLFKETGAFPFGSLVLAYNGKFYGTCYAGGSNTLGVIFELDPTTGVVTKKFDFDALTGGRPAFNMTLATNGKLWNYRQWGNAWLGYYFRF